MLTIMRTETYEYAQGLLQVASLGSPPTALGDSTSLSSQAMECGDMEATLRLNLAGNEHLSHLANY